MNPLKEFLIVLVSVFLLLGFTTYPARVAPLSVNDDLYYLNIADPDSIFLASYDRTETYTSFSTYYHYFSSTENRFCPLAYAATWEIAKLTSADPTKIQTLLFMLSVICVVLFYFFLRGISISFFLSFLFTLLFLLGRYDNIWYRRSGETFALIFLFLALISFIYFSKTERRTLALLSLISLLISSMFKETFLVLLPFAVLFLVFKYASVKRVDLKTAIGNTLFYSLPVLVFLMYAVLQLSNTSASNYGYITKYFSAHFFIHNLNVLSGNYYTHFPIIILGSFLIIKKQFRLKHILFLGSWLIFLLIQCLIYQWIEVPDAGRYLMPAFLFPILACALLTEQLRKTEFRKIYTGVLLFFIPVLILNAKNVYINADYFRAKSKAFQHLVNVISQKVNPESEKIIILADEGKTDGFLKSFAAFMSKKNVEIPVRNISYAEIRDSLVARHETNELLTKAESKIPTIRKDLFKYETAAEDSLKWVVFSTPGIDCDHQNKEFAFGFKKKLCFVEPCFNADIKEVIFAFIGNREIKKNSVSYVVYHR